MTNRAKIAKFKDLGIFAKPARMPTYEMTVRKPVRIDMVIYRNQ